jgi:hypothetical protein
MPNALGFDLKKESTSFDTLESSAYGFRSEQIDHPVNH